jgi:hypothetical protein
MIFLINNRNNLNLILILLYQQLYILENLKLGHLNRIVIQKHRLIRLKNIEVVSLNKIFNQIINKKGQIYTQKKFNKINLIRKRNSLFKNFKKISY